MAAHICRWMKAILNKKEKHFAFPVKGEIETGVLKGYDGTANEFNEFFTSVGARAAAESKSLASVNVFPTRGIPIPRSYYL